jgi:hypothetical protein
MNGKKRRPPWWFKLAILVGMAAAVSLVVAADALTE